MDIDPDILRRYWTGKCTNEEIRMVKIWMEAGQPEEKYPVGSDLDKNALKEDLWTSLAGQTGINHSIDHAGANRIIRSGTGSWLTYGMIAASLIFVILWVYTRPAAVKRNEIVYRYIEVPNGQTKTVILPDGSKIQLNSGSSIRFPNRFDDSVRHVVLKGEAFFIVSKNQKKPFIVETDRTHTRVLGTRFNLRDYKNEVSGSVTVEEGRVSFESQMASSPQIILGADEQGELLEGQLQKKTVRAADFSSWREKILRFDDIPLSRAIPMLERHYDVHIRIKNNRIGQIKIKGTFRDMSLEKIMEELAYLLNIRYRIEEKQVNIY